MQTFLSPLIDSLLLSGWLMCICKAKGLSERYSSLSSLTFSGLHCSNRDLSELVYILSRDFLSNQI